MAKPDRHAEWHGGRESRSAALHTGLSRRDVARPLLRVRYSSAASSSRRAMASSNSAGSGIRLTTRWPSSVKS